MATSPTTHWEPRPLPSEDTRRFPAWLFAPASDLPQETGHVDESTCGLDAAFERIDRRLTWFDADASAREMA